MDLYSNLPKSLPKKELYALFIKMNNNDYDARNKIIIHNLRLVIKTAIKYINPNIQLDDLISIGIIGLIKAVDTFNINKGNEFSTYAIKCINNEILQNLRKQNNEINYIFFEDLYNKETDKHMVIDTISSNEDLEANFIEKEYINYFLTKLPMKEQTILKLYFGFYNKNYNQSQIAQILNVTQSHISRIIKQSLIKLRTMIKVDSLNSEVITYLIYKIKIKYPKLSTKDILIYFYKYISKYNSEYLNIIKDYFALNDSEINDITNNIKNIISNKTLCLMINNVNN